MKIKLIYLILLLLSFTSVNLIAQSWSLGVAAIYGDDIDNLGIHARGYYNFPGDKVCLGPEYSYFFNSTRLIDGTKVDIRLSELNFNAHYIVELSEHWGIYPLAGVNLSFERVEYLDNPQINSETERVWGLNLGIGIHRSIGPVIVFTEYDRLLSDLAQNAIVVGAFITIGKSHSSSEE